uniref:SAM domain-containing protein n=1 Tax=Dracunculus medinensis TaxID=318479 RepID=A0A0N4UD70_DRAME
LLAVRRLVYRIKLFSSKSAYTEVLNLHSGVQVSLPWQSIKISELPSTPSPSSSLIIPPGQQSRPPSKQPATFSEWQLLAVLHRANLIQYYDEFIAQGGDDINQFMTCDEHEFLEIMSVVGMASKPLHVRRFQRTLTEYNEEYKIQEFSKDPDAFNLVAIQQIGVPPVTNYGLSSSSTTAPTTAAALQFLLSSQSLAAASLAVAASLPSTSPSTIPEKNSPRQLIQPTTSCHLPINSSNCTIYILQYTPFTYFLPIEIQSMLIYQFSSKYNGISATDSNHDGSILSTCGISSVGATANVSAGDILTNLVGTQSTMMGIPNINNQETLNCADTSNVATTLIGTIDHSNTNSGFTQHLASSPSAAATFEANCDYEQTVPGVSAIMETPVLTDAQINKITECSNRLIERMPHLEPKLIQNKKKISRELLDVMQLPHGSPQRLQEYRKYSAIYGRFDAKRKPDKPLTLHEVSVNEAAAQLCLRQPALLTRRDELFPLARQVKTFFDRGLSHLGTTIRNVPLITGITLAFTVVKDAGYNYVKGMKRNDTEIRKRLALATEFYASEPSQSPQSSVSAGTPPLEEANPESNYDPTASLREESHHISRKRRHIDLLTDHQSNIASSTAVTTSHQNANIKSDYGNNSNH